LLNCGNSFRKNCKVINNEYLLDKTEKFDIINNEYAKKRYCTKVINREYIKKMGFIDDRNFACKEIADIFNRSLCKGNGERYLAFFRLVYGKQFYYVWEYKYLEIDDFELKYKDTNNNDNYFFDDDIFYVIEFENWSYTIANPDDNFDFTIKDDPLFESFDIKDSYCNNGEIENGSLFYFIGIVKDKKNNKFYFIVGEYAIELKKYKEII